ncbi:UNVERIFIED_ORG: ectoine hydroxylase-related dioxygenase (phytanoyl-CoA dioxygenase family) [Agrobacterium larrymoorei]|uniref:Phytanoyl-CoA dioxygenase family protein n=1 Tax=Agrobacterium cavarae TaxID=2528239 RepID=A0ABY1YD51_9HYPH|nr:phytanoyl-CoA dioxygenase family protein [Agrobacterium cavarae]MDP9573973.1 ectoine hydroxylase-related dioxygenase (phytanoyl-CoA dioxygenase family) [Agrobacterium larrymoorei]TBN18450.1 phytanoyl-CoA dioxygenase family protein [Agrobacterium cavarae]
MFESSETTDHILSKEQVAFFDSHGWVLVPGFFDAKTTSDLLSWTEEVTGMPEVAGGNMVYHEPSLLDPGALVIQRIENFCPRHAGFDELVRQSSLVKAVSQVLGGDACLFKDKINFKMSGGAGFDVHQDQQAGWSKYAPLFITALVCLDAATTANGCLEMAQIPRLKKLIAPEWRPVAEEELAGVELFPVPTEPGDLLLFDSFALHASKPNLSETKRRLLYLTYNLRSEGDHREAYFEDKRASFPPDIEREANTTYTFKV